LCETFVSDLTPLHLLAIRYDSSRNTTTVSIDTGTNDNGDNLNMVFENCKIWLLNAQIDQDFLGIIAKPRLALEGKTVDLFNGEDGKVPRWVCRDPFCNKYEYNSFYSYH
jgi:hypothetical protein